MGPYYIIYRGLIINIELYLLRYFFSASAYQKYASFVEKKFLKDNSPDIHRIFTSIGNWHSKFPNKDVSSVADFRVFHYTLFPPTSEKESEATENLLGKLGQMQPEEAIAQDFLIEHLRRSKAVGVSLLALDVSEGRKPFSALLEGMEDLKTIRLPQEVASNEFVTVSEEGGFPDQGFRWRLGALNRSLGSLRRGDNGFVHARPEAGKTTFALSEGTSMALQAESGPAIYFNNEQPGELMYYRAVQAYLGINTETFFKYKAKAIQKFREQIGDRFHIYDSAYMQRKDVERVCRTYNPALLVFDQLPKIKGFQDDRHDLEMGAVFQWARELAKEYGPTIGLCQTGGSGEGKKWLEMDDVANSKTSMQAEADWIIGIGKSHQEGLESIRHISISKNKLLGDHDTDPKQRHGKFEVRINPLICRYEDL